MEISCLVKEFLSIIFFTLAHTRTLRVACQVLPGQKNGFVYGGKKERCFDDADLARKAFDVSENDNPFDSLETAWYFAPLFA